MACGLSQELRTDAQILSQLNSCTCLCTVHSALTVKCVFISCQYTSSSLYLNEERQGEEIDQDLFN